LEKKNKVISQHEKRVIAYHESGHASVSWLLRYAHPLVKVTIVPRGKSLGAAWYLPEERQITTYEQLFDEITATLAGRASEELVFGKISTGALNDLERVTKQAFAMVAYYGLNPKIGNISYYDSTGQSEMGFTKPFSEKTAETIDQEVHKMLEEAYQRAKQILSENRDKLDQLAALLVEREVIFREDLEEIYGKRPFEDENKTDNQPKGETTEITENKTTTENSDSEPIVENTNIANNPTNE
jgi:cell division protease FtsH